MNLIHPRGLHERRLKGRFERLALHNNAASGGGGAQTYNSLIASLSPLIDLRLDDTSGLTAVDSSGNGYDGSYVNAPALDQAPILQEGRAVTMVASADEYLQIPHNDAFNVDYVTLLLWFNWTANTENFAPLIARGQGNEPNSSFLVRENSNALQFQAKGTPNVSVTAASTHVPKGSDLFLAAVFSSTHIRIYINGVERDSATHSSTLQTMADEEIRIGRDGGYTNRNIDAKVDHFTMFDYALTQQNITDLYNLGSGA